MVATKNSAKSKYVEAISRAVQENLQCKNIAVYLGESEATVCASAPAVAWKNAMADPGKVFEKLYAKYKAAYTGGKA